MLDATAGARSDPSGIGRYVHELLAALHRAAPALQLTVGVRLSRFRGRRYLPLRGELPACVLDDRLDRWFLRGHDLFHGLDARITPARHLRRVATLHDVFSAEHTDLAREGFRRKKIARYERLAAEADAVVCVSGATEERFLHSFPAARGRTHVIHLGVSSQFQPASPEEVAEVRRRLKLPATFLLFVGLLSTRKNVCVLLQAFDELAEGEPAVHLVLAGRESHGYGEIHALLGSMRHSSRVLAPGFVSGADLPALYSAAVAFVFPSRAEGFGLPVLEAMACGTRVLASDLPVLREIGGPARRVAAGAEASVWARELRAVLHAADAPGERSSRIAWARRFSWDEAAQRTLNLYRALLGETP